MRDVARRAGVHVSVVSRYLNQDPRQSIAAGTAAAIALAVEELHYRPNLTARALRTSRSQTVALLLGELANPLFESLIDGVYRAANGAGYSVVLERVPTASKLPLDRYQQAGFDGLLIGGGAVDEAHLRTLTDTAFPLVVLHQRSDSTVWVDADDEAGADLALDHVVGLGHRSIGVVAGPIQSGATQRRVQRLRTHGADAGIAELPTVAADGLGAHHGRQAALRLLAHHPDLTCLVATSSVLAIGAVRAASELHRHVPDDLSVIALSDVEIAEYLVPALSAVRVPAEKIGAVGFEVLRTILQGRRSESVVVDEKPQLFVRETTEIPASPACAADPAYVRAPRGRNPRGPVSPTMPD